MRIRFQVLLPLAVGLLLAVGFFLAAAAVGDAVRDQLITVPGLTRDRAVEAVVATLTLAGFAVTIVAVLVAVWIARLVVRPLVQLRRAAERTPGEAEIDLPTTPIAEIDDLAGALDRAAGALRDRAARARRERVELAALLEAASEGIMRVGPDGRVARANPASRALLSLPDEPVGRPVAAVLRSDELRRLVQRVATGGTDAAEVAEVVLDDRRILASAAPQEGGGAVATFVDLTDLRRLEEVRRDFVANASHELKTPLTSIRGYTETLRAGDLPEAERRQFLDTIARNAERLQRIVDDLLDLSRLEAGRWQANLEAVPVLDVAERCWTAFAERAAAREIAFGTQVIGDDVAHADAPGLELVFSNLFDNALRHTPPGGSVRVTAHAEGGGDDAAEARLRVDVADTGSGIPRDALPRIFERFYRVDPARSRAEGGTGLGLSIVRHMVEAMGGRVEAESALGKGTTIRLWLPRGRR